MGRLAWARTRCQPGQRPWGQELTIDLVGGSLEGVGRGTTQSNSTFWNGIKAADFSASQHSLNSVQHMRNTLTGSVTVLVFPSPERILSLAVVMQSALLSKAAFTSGPRADDILWELLEE